MQYFNQVIATNLPGTTKCTVARGFQVRLTGRQRIGLLKTGGLGEISGGSAGGLSSLSPPVPRWRRRYTYSASLTFLLPLSSSSNSNKYLFPRAESRRFSTLIIRSKVYILKICHNRNARNKGGFTNHSYIKGTLACHK